MEKQNKIYLRILIGSQIAICFVIFVLIFLLSKNISGHNSDILRMLAISNTEKNMEEMVNNTIVRIDLKRNLAEQQVASLANLIVKQVEQSNSRDIESITNSIYKEFSNNEYGSAIEFSLLDNSTGEVLLSTEKGIELITSKQIENLKKESTLLKNVIKEKYRLLVYARQNMIDMIVKEQVRQEIHNAIYPDNEYIWVNEILNYEGGDKYAIRAIHPNLIETEGDFLSTNTQDIVGNYPYIKELEGIKERGEILQTYYFKNKTNDKIDEKLSYAKLYKPFNWIIATGKPLGDMFMYTEKLREYDNSVVYRTMILSLVLTVLIFICSIVIIVRWQNRFLTYVDTYVKIETELDPLTGALTRKTAEKYLHGQLENRLHTDGPPLFIMIDVDNFKHVNDTYGHDIGDVVLQKVSKTILSCTRNGDKLFRWGGEEFLLICQGVKYETQIAFAEKILSNVNSIVFEANGETFRVSISMGGSYVSTEDGDIDYMKVIKKSDNALYKAKHTGKNKYCT